MEIGAAIVVVARQRSIAVKIVLVYLFILWWIALGIDTPRNPSGVGFLDVLLCVVDG